VTGNLSTGDLIKKMKIAEEKAPFQENLATFVS